MEVKTKVFILLAVFIACAAVSQGMPMARMQALRCLCIEPQSKFIPPRHFLNVEIIPKGPHCKNVEVIATLKTEEKVCLEPTAPWVKKIIDKMLVNSKPREISH
ncbi:interleukin-8-like [Spea bombifrons]|uniref:interleukin-8-like n=1 Tax=Spea bombifrons TaxID=233779 RepID=UPI00234A85A1|nr:interleukin-8-like [Spea bombifrons]